MSKNVVLSACCYFRIATGFFGRSRKALLAIAFGLALCNSIFCATSAQAKTAGSNSGRL